MRVLMLARALTTIICLLTTVGACALPPPSSQPRPGSQQVMLALALGSQQPLA